MRSVWCEELWRFVRRRAKLAWFGLAFAMAVVGFAAEPTISVAVQPRYPWNGLVDIRFTLAGESGTKYDTSFTARDVAGGTNLTMRTLYKSNGAVANVGKEALLPGTYNWVWDAQEDLTSRWVSYSECVPTNRAVLFTNVQLNELSDFYAVPCGKAVSDKSNLARGRYVKDDGAGKSIQFAFSDDVYTKCVCVHVEQSGPDVVGYVQWARYVTGTGHEQSDFDANSAKTMSIATTETASGYGLLRMEAKGLKLNASMAVERVVVDCDMTVSLFLYTVKFNANGGTGTMANESFTYGTAKALTANAFTRTGFAFDGWAKSASGTKAYSDKQSVSNLTATPGGTFNLYAVWKATGGVQLWANGPYWAECNVGATKPEDYGYYFWWGDTVGYKRNGSKWDAVDGSKTGFSFEEKNCPTCDPLQAAGYIDSTGNLVAEHDAAITHLGAPWRMPTSDELLALQNNCDTKWTTQGGVSGRIVKGRGAYSSKQIFLPAAGYGLGSDIQYSFINSSKSGFYWMSTTGRDARVLYFDSFGFVYAYSDSGVLQGAFHDAPRYFGCTIRPVR